MRIILTGLAVLTLAGCGEAASPGAPAADPAERIFEGGVIYTGGDNNRQVDMVAVAGGRIVCAGEAEACEAYAGPATEHIDLNGAALFPGFTDAHVHILGVGMREMNLNLDDVRSIAELQARVAEAAQDDTGVIAGRGWIETHWPEGRFPTAADLDAVAPAARLCWCAPTAMRWWPIRLRWLKRA